MFVQLSFVAALAVFTSSTHAQINGEYPFDLTTLTAPDDSITASFVSFGATLTELWVKDRDGEKRDVILGYDDNSKLLTDPNHPVFNAIVGRYANRIKNGTFSIPITKEAQPPGPDVYQIPTNDHDGQVTLHGGIYGWDRRNWTITESTNTSVTYKHVDEADEGFPGTVTAFVTHSVSNGGKLHISIHAEATELTPIMLTQHVYWNLDAFVDKVANETVIASHHLQIASDEVVILDGNSIPLGPFLEVEETPFDFRKDTGPLEDRWNQTVDLCGAGCQGFDHEWIYSKPKDKGTKASLWSDKTGIRVDIATDQPAIQGYSANWVELPRKIVHGGPDLNYTKWSAFALEQQGYVDAINTPEWNVDQIYGPDRPYAWNSTYSFSIAK